MSACPHLEPIVEADDGAGLDVCPGKQSLASILDAALPHLDKYRLIRVREVRGPEIISCYTEH